MLNKNKYARECCECQVEPRIAFANRDATAIKNACIETGRRIKIQRPTATENIDKRKEVAIVNIQGWPRSNGREQEHDGKEEKDEEEEEDEREGSLEPKNSDDRVLTLIARHRSELIFVRAMSTHGELNGTSSLPSANNRARRRLIRLSADTPINTTYSSRFIHVSSYQLSLHGEYDTVVYVIGDIYNFVAINVNLTSSELMSKSVIQLLTLDL